MLTLNKNVWHESAIPYLLRGNYLMIKNTRGGATTGTIGEGINQYRTTLLISPTHSINKITAREGIMFTDRGKNGDVICTHIEPNSQCVKIQEMIDEYPILKKAKIIPMRHECMWKDDGEIQYCEHYNKCPVTKPLTLKDKDIDVITVTLPKLSALYVAATNAKMKMHDNRLRNKDYVEPLSLQLYNKLKALGDIILIDEAHKLETPEIVSMLLMERGEIHGCSEMTFIDAEKYPMCRAVINTYNALTLEQKVVTTARLMHDRSRKDNYWKEHLSKSIHNPNKLVFKDEDGTPYENQAVGFAIIFEEIISLMVEMFDEYGEFAPVDSIVSIYNMVNIVTSNIISVSAIRDDDSRTVINLEVVDTTKNVALAGFLHDVQDGSKSVIFSSATISGHHDYSQYVDGELKPIMWGGDGDPMHAFANVLVLSDSRRFNMREGYSQDDRGEEICSSIESFIEIFGSENVIIFAQSAKKASAFEYQLKQRDKHPHKVLYYGCSESIGVSCTARICLCIGMAEKPSSTCDSMTTDSVLSKILRMNMVHADTMQATSRSKDPSAIIPSIVVIYGENQKNVEAMLTWGSNRKINIDDEGNVKVTCDQYIPRPIVVKCHTNEDFIREAIKFKQSVYKGDNRMLQETSEDDLYIHYKNRVSVIITKVPMFKDIYTKGKNTAIQYNKSDKIIGRHDGYRVYGKEGYNHYDDPITQEVIEEHVKGKKKISVCMLRPDNTVGCICFTIDRKYGVNSIQYKNQLVNFLDALPFQYDIEANGDNSFRIFVYLPEFINARDARAFGKELLKEIDVEEEIEIFPKTCMIKKDTKGDYIELPRTISMPAPIAALN